MSHIKSTKITLLVGADNRNTVAPALEKYPQFTAICVSKPDFLFQPHFAADKLNAFQFAQFVYCFLGDPGQS